jgi:hypothetical protein
MFQPIRCLLGKHTPDRRCVREHHGDFFAPCTGCRKRMYRDPGGWRLAQPGESFRPGDAPGSPYGRRIGHPRTRAADTQRTDAAQ